MDIPICVFEGEQFKQLLPLVYIRPIYDLRCGIKTIKEKIFDCFETQERYLHCREYLTDLVKRENPNIPVNVINSDICLFINGKVLPDENLINIINEADHDTLFVNGEYIIAARVSGLNLKKFKNSLNTVFRLTDFHGLVRKEVDANTINYPWDLIKYNSLEIEKDFKSFNDQKEKIWGQVYNGAHLVNEKNIIIDEGAKVKPGAVLDAESGSIYIGKNAEIMANSTIIGPAYIGNNSVIKIGAKIYGSTSIGQFCKVGGEVEGSVIHSYSNKQHDGFLGHSYIAQWVNIGADTNNSDLKNNYGSVKVIINDRQLDSGLMFVGLVMGDHSKSAINSMFNTGTVVGVSCNIFGEGFPPKYVPSFCWGGKDTFTTYELEKSIDVAKKVMKRRNCEFTEIEEELFKKVFDLTQDERKKRGLPQ
jgi:UDP-N-acetylglucosamine diphosphorylase / glucose-1-phosphate thymidylyltransferase / UDP-N-acetylgalactosamine diphosphorylase / glucosamine-1-phosphate N-acetyltransferase / galactosamine-1-phosphate N-acetyltransferase